MLASSTTVPTCTSGGTAASALGVPHGVGWVGSLAVQLPAVKPLPTSAGVSSAAWACSSTVA